MTIEERITKALQAEGILSPNVLAYALATIKHETAGTMEPIREYGGPQQAIKLGYRGGKNYYGRGYIQLTHDYNYRTIGQRIGMGDELVKNPDLALDPDIAAKILAAFFKDRGVAAAAEKGDFYGARRGVNGTDKADKIAQLAKQYLPQATELSKNTSKEPVLAVTPTPQNKNIFQEMRDKFQNMFVPQPVKAVEATPVGTPKKDQPNPMLKPEQDPNTPGPYYGKSIGSYQVKPGDTLSALAKQYGTTVTDFARINKIQNPNMIRAGQSLEVPASITDTNKASGYTIRSGDTLTSIARNLGTTVNDLVRKNGIQNPNLIRAGAKIKI